MSLVLHTFDRGGSGRVAGYLARGFADLGMNVDLLIFRQGGAVQGAVMDLIGNDVPVRFLGRSRGPRPLDLVRGLPALVGALRRERPDFVIAAANNVALVTAIAIKLARVRGSRLYIKTTNPIASSRHRGLVRWLRLLGYRLIFPWTAAVLTLSRDESQEMEAAFPRFPGLFRNVANPYVTPAMLAPVQKRSSVDGPKTIISLARLDRQKRLERLIAAFAQVKHADTRLLILGEGEERTSLTELIEQLGLTARVSMPGHVADVVPALHDADLFVLTSDYEGLPAAVLEAMAANCPVLATPCFPSARALLDDAEGCAVIEHADPARLAALIDKHLMNPRPIHLRDVAERYSIANGIASHVAALVAAPQFTRRR